MGGKKAKFRYVYSQIINKIKDIFTNVEWLTANIPKTPELK